MDFVDVGVLIRTIPVPVLWTMSRPPEAILAASRVVGTCMFCSANVFKCLDYTGLMRKDLTLAIEAGNSVKAPTPLGAAAHQLYGILAAHG